MGRLPVNGAFITVDAIGATPAVAAAIQEAGADYVAALKANQPSLQAEVELFFTDPANAGLPSLEVVDPAKIVLPGATTWRRWAPILALSVRTDGPDDS